jgi:hypothetical protein
LKGLQGVATLEWEEAPKEYEDGKIEGLEGNG